MSIEVVDLIAQPPSFLAALAVAFGAVTNTAAFAMTTVHLTGRRAFPVKLPAVAAVVPTFALALLVI